MSKILRCMVRFREIGYSYSIIEFIFCYFFQMTLFFYDPKIHNVSYKTIDDFNDTDFQSTGKRLMTFRLMTPRIMNPGNFNSFAIWQKTFLALGLATGLMLQSGCGGAAPVVPEKSNEPTQVETPKELGPVETFQAMQKRLADGDMVAIWDTLPATYQKEVESVVKEFAGKMDPEVWSQLFGVIGKLQTVAANKKDILTEMMKSNPQFTKPEDASFAHEQALAIVSSLNNDKVNKLESLKNFDGPTVIKSTLNPLYAAIMKMYDKFELPGKGNVSPAQFLKDAKIELVKVDGDKATIKIMQGTDEPKEQILVKVEGKWIPEDLQKNFSESMTSAKESLAGITPESMTAVKQQMMPMVTMINTTLENMDKADTAEQFQGAAMGMMGPMMMMMGSNPLMGSPPATEPVPATAVKPDEPKSEGNPTEGTPEVNKPEVK